jgi:hypothetical protein
MEDIEAQDIKIGDSPWDIDGDPFNHDNQHPAQVTEANIDIDGWVWLTVTNEVSGGQTTYRLTRHELITIL